MNSPFVNTPSNLSDWAELGIDPPKDEHEEARLVSLIESGALSLTAIIPTDGSEPYVVLAQVLTPKFPVMVTTTEQREASTKAFSFSSSLGIAVVARALQDMVDPNFVLTIEDWDSVRKFLLDNVETVRGELNGPEEKSRLIAAKLIYLCCTPLKIPNNGEILLFNKDGENQFAAMLSDALKVFRG